jgi:hypothetical protein
MKRKSKEEPRDERQIELGIRQNRRQNRFAPFRKLLREAEEIFW